jgi:PKD repeat protein
VSIGGVFIEGGTARVSGTFVDRGIEGGHEVRIDWGDGSGLTMTVTPGSRAFALEHIYRANNPGELPYAAMLELTDSNGATTSRALMIPVFNAAPNVSVNGPARGEIGQRLDFAGLAFDPGVDDAVEISWDFGDGTVLPFVSGRDPANLAPSHRFAQAGTYAVMLLARDSEGAVGRSMIPVTIREPLPVPPPLPPVGGGPGLRGGGVRGPRVIGETPGGTLIEFVSARDLVAHLTVSEEEVGLPLAPMELQGPDLGIIPTLNPGSWDDSLYGLVERLYGTTAAPLRIDEFTVSSADQSLVIKLRFSGDAGTSLESGDLIITVDGATVEASRIEFAYDSTTSTGTWKVEGATSGTLKLELDGNGVLSAEGEMLDGDNDGAAGGRFQREVPIPAPESKDSVDSAVEQP